MQQRTIANRLRLEHNEESWEHEKVWLDRLCRLSEPLP